MNNYFQKSRMHLGVMNYSIFGTQVHAENTEKLSERVKILLNNMRIVAKVLSKCRVKLKVAREFVSALCIYIHSTFSLKYS